jgi:hypothetical protein
MRQPIEGAQARCANVFLRVSRQTGDGDLQTPSVARGYSDPKNRIECRNSVSLSVFVVMMCVKSK